MGLTRDPYYVAGRKENIPELNQKWIDKIPKKRNKNKFGTILWIRPEYKEKYWYRK